MSMVRLFPRFGFLSLFVVGLVGCGAPIANDGSVAGVSTEGITCRGRIG
jgi:hypothetical protein